MKQFGLPKTCLLRKNREFEQVYRQGKRLYGEGFTLVYSHNQLPHNRLGISIHRRIKGAVRRNRIKRIIRESFRLHRELYPDCADVVFTVKQGFAPSSPADVAQAVSLLTHSGGRDDGA